MNDIEKAAEELAEVKKRLSEMTPDETAKWLEKVHDEYVEQVRYTVFGGADFLSGTDTLSRVHIVNYMHQVVNMMHMFELDNLSNEVGNILMKDCYTDLFLILNLLNFL